MMGGMLFVASASLFLLSIFMIFTDNKIMNIIYSSLGVLLYGVYLIYDTQLIIGGKYN